MSRSTRASSTAELHARTLERKIRLSRLALAVETAWPRLWPPVMVVLAFVLASLAGLWPMLTAGVHQAVLALFGLALAATLVPLVRMPWPGREAGLRRLERLSNVPHRPASAYEDSIDERKAGPTERRLWSAHRSRIARLLALLRVRGPAPRFERYDPLALRGLVVLLTGLAAIWSGDAFYDRLASAFRIGDAGRVASVRLDAWVAPPVYTRATPMMLADGAKPFVAQDGEMAPIEVPEGSVLIVRASGSGHERFGVEVSREGAGTETLAAGEQTTGATGVSSYRLELREAAKVAITERGSVRQEWAFLVKPDHPPVIELVGKPQQSLRGNMTLTYRISDDYGVVAAEAQIALAEQEKPPRPATAADGKPLLPVGEPPVVRLKLPKKDGEKPGEAKTSADLAAHPWAGLPVILTLQARDQAGKTGESPAHAFNMPGRRFAQPLAKALVEQRRNLARNPADYAIVAFALDALAVGPELFGIEPFAYLGLRTAYWRLSRNVTQDSIVATVDQLWELAVRIEDGDLSDAMRALREAQERLARALEEGASDEEIERLMQELRQAMANYLQSLMQQAERNPELQADPRTGERMTSRDLDQMLKDIEKLAKSGSMEAAQQLLSQLRDMLDRMQAGRSNQQNGEGNGELSKMLEQFGGLITKQRRLLDDTFRANRGNRNGRGQGDQSGEQQGLNDLQGNQEGHEYSGELSGRQGALRDELDRLMQALREFGQNGNREFDGAGRAMDRAREALEGENLDEATEEQSQALEQLRRGAQSMTEEMLRGSNGQQGTRLGRNMRDPLNRPLGNEGDPNGFVEIPRDIEVQRAREILDELRRRLGESTRPLLELDYLERLLKRN